MVFEIEPREVGVQLIGDGAQQRIMIFEDAEGGIGVLEQVSSRAGVLSEIARRALEACHFNPDSGEPLADWNDRCAVACYDCLLSFSNQLEHPVINRYLVRDYLVALREAQVMPRSAGRSRDDHYQWLRERTDPSSDFERDFLLFLFDNGYRLPDQAQYRPAEGVFVQPDFYYERDGAPGVCIFVDGPVHDQQEERERDAQLRGELDNLGYRVVAIRYDRPMAEQVAENLDVFSAE